jgi:dolichol-phosphate mannosyltransferase
MCYNIGGLSGAGDYCWRVPWEEGKYKDFDVLRQLKIVSGGLGEPMTAGASARASVSVLVPTLNEEENIDPLLERLLAVRQQANLDFDVVFIDSASTDDTCGRVEAWADKGPVKMLCRDINVGLAGAVIAGAKHVDSDIVLVMDADLSHPPEAIPMLLQPIFAGGYDMVIGSRYVSGGATPDWPFSRRLSSRLATIPALLFCEVKDPLAGFFAVWRRLIAELPGEVPGFKIGLAILAEYGSELRVKELPIQFHDRDLGQSKMNRAVIIDYGKQLAALFGGRLRNRLRGVRTGFWLR